MYTEKGDKETSLVFCVLTTLISQPPLNLRTSSLTTHEKLQTLAHVLGCTAENQDDDALALLRSINDRLSSKQTPWTAESTRLMTTSLDEVQEVFSFLPIVPHC
jgi:hypothetical protein